MTYPTQSVTSNSLPGTGVFGFSQVQVFGVSGTFVVPPGVNNVRVRVWGGGGGSAAGGGGFTMRTIYNLAGSGVTSVAVTVGLGTAGNGGTSSFGTFCSATGGATGGPYPAAGGTGVGGDINTSGGASQTSNSGGGGVGSLWGSGGRGGLNGTTLSGASGGGANGGYSGGSGLSGCGGFNDTAKMFGPQTAMSSIDWIGTGGGGSTAQNGVNGGGGGTNGNGGFPGGGGGSNGTGANGLVIVEY